MKNSKKTKLWLVGLFMAQILIQQACANGIASSTLGTGTKNLLNDIASFLVVLSPVGGGIGAGYNLIRRSLSDEQNGVKYKNQALISVGCGVAGILVSGVIAVIASYYQG